MADEICCICEDRTPATGNRTYYTWATRCTRWLCGPHLAEWDKRMSLRAPAAGPGVFRAMLDEGCRKVREAQAATNAGKEVVNA